MGQAGWVPADAVPLHRPVKVERTRKRSEGFQLDRKVEKKKGEGQQPGSAAEFAAGGGPGKAGSLVWEGARWTGPRHP